MPLGFRILPLVSLLFLSGIAGAQTTASFEAGTNRAETSVTFCDLNRVVSNADTVVTTGASSKVTLGVRLLNKVDDDLISQFKKAWAISKAGFDSCEGLVVVFLLQDGRYVGRSPGSTNEFEQVSFKFDPATIATTRVMDGLDWLEPSKWANWTAKHHTPVDEYSDLSN